MRSRYLLPLLTVGVLAGCSDSTAPAQAGNGRTAAPPGAPGTAKSGDAKPGTGAKSGGPGAAGAKQGPPVLVELGEVREGTLTDGWTFLGRVEPALASELATAVSGHVVSVRAREGDHVSARAILLTLDSSKIQAELAASRAKEHGLDAELEHAKKQYERISTLEYPAVSEPERDRFQLDIAKLEAQQASQKAETRRLQVELNRHSLTAPFDGVISARHVDPGAWVNPGTPVLGLVSLAELEVHVDVSADLGTRVRVGQSATLRRPGTRAGTKAGAEIEISAEIAGIVGVLDQATRTMRVRLLPKERPDWLISGMALDVEFPVTVSGDDLGAQGVLVSRDALVRGPVRTRVIKVVDGAAVPVYVHVLATAKDMALVMSEVDEPSLAPGDQVVIRGNERLRPGQPLQIGQAKPSPGQGDGKAAETKD